MSKDMDFCYSREIYLANKENNYWILHAKTGLHALKTTSKKLVHKASESIGKFIGNKIVDKIAIPKPILNENLRNVGQVVIPSEKREEISNELRQVF